MEQRRLLNFIGLSIQNRRLDTQIVILTIQILFLITQTGCKQPIENPELVDPLYLDLVSESNAAKSKIASELKNIADTKQKIAELAPRDSSRPALIRELNMYERNLVIARQNRVYFEVRAKQRKGFDSEAYSKAFEADLPWPNPEEVATFKKMKALRSASRNWEDRVPKTTRYNRAPATNESKSVQKGEDSGGGSHH